MSGKDELLFIKACGKRSLLPAIPCVPRDRHFISNMILAEVQNIVYLMKHDACLFDVLLDIYVSSKADTSEKKEGSMKEGCLPESFDSLSHSMSIGYSSIDNDVQSSTQEKNTPKEPAGFECSAIEKVFDLAKARCSPSPDTSLRRTKFSPQTDLTDI